MKDRLNGVSAISIAKGKSSEWTTLRDELVRETSFLDTQLSSAPSIATRMFCVLNDVKEVPRCKECGSYTVANKLNNKLGFSKFCSTACSRIGSDLSDEILEKLKSKDWLYEHRIDKKMSWEDIATVLGCSTMPVKKYAKIHEIPEVNYNVSSNEVSSVLTDKEALSAMYKSGKSIYVIGEEIGCSPSFVSVWLNRHGIDITPSNAYPRKHITVSIGCQEVIDYIREIYDGEIIVNDRRTLGDGRELDILIPEKNLAIEYNGVWSHQFRPYESTVSKIKGEDYHRSKFLMARDKGISLFTIWSDDWASKNVIIKGMLSNKLGVQKTRIYARKCELRQTDLHSGFFEANHIQGRDRSAFIAYGLFYENELIACMSFGRSRYNKAYTFELSRFACKVGVSVPGAFSRLLAAFRKAYDGSIISYADCDHSNGDVYRKNGFSVIRENKAAYWYVAKNSEKMEHRFKYRKAAIAEEGDTRTEEQIMYSRGYYKVFDCGMIAFGLTTQ